MLTSAQINAIAYISNYAKSRKLNAINTIDHILKMSDVSRFNFDELIDKTMSNARVTLHFHPDRLGPQMKSVAEALLEWGIYKNQFETLLSSGSVSAYAGGARDTWENNLFGGAYQQAGIDNSQRPKYGALELLAHSDGPSPRFGSCYFVLKPEVTKRCTFTYLDSHREPEEKGTSDEFDDILAALINDSFTEELVLGEKLRPPQLLDRFAKSLAASMEERFQRPPRRILDHYIEAQIHGSVSLETDVEFLIADPSFKETTTADFFKAICEKYAIELHWHQGFKLKTSEVPSDFRGPTMPSLAKRVAPDGILNTQKIGEAAAALKLDPRAWSDRGSEQEVLQELKLLWHVLLKYGKPMD